MEWVKEFLTNSCDINLVKRLDEKLDQLFAYEQRGSTYLKFALNEMFTMSNMVISLLQKFLKQFAQEGVARVPNEDVQLCAKQLAAVCACLVEVDALPQPDVWLWNSKRSTNYLPLPIKYARCRQSVGSGTVTLLLQQFKNFAAKLMTCSTP